MLGESTSDVTEEKIKEVGKRRGCGGGGQQDGHKKRKEFE